MKYAVVLGDGMADYKIPALGDKTPLETANIPAMNKLAALGQTGLAATIPEGYKPGSDIANLSVLGYPAAEFYTGRSPLEALSMGVDMDDKDIAVRCNLVTIENGIMKDYSAGEISTEEAVTLISDIQKKLGSSKFRFHAGLSYRHCLVVKNGDPTIPLQPPHDITGQSSDDNLPKDGEYLRLIRESGEILKNHPVNLKRLANGQNPATHIWLWGAGKKTKLESFYERYGLKGSIISAVDLLKGIAKGSGMNAPEVDGATGNIHTNFKGKTDAVISEFKNGADFVYLHIEAPDECGHQGDTYGKIKAIEEVDASLKRVWDYLESTNEPYRLVLLPDHATPLKLKTHTSEPVPYVIYKSEKPFNSGLKFNETDAQNGVYLQNGSDILKTMLER